MLDLSVIVPVRNAESFIEECLESIVRSGPREIIVVDGDSVDKTVELAVRYPVKILSDEGQGVAAARMLGVGAATADVVALIDVDIVLPDGALARLYDEFRRDGYIALQAGLHSTSGPGYWGRALAFHHNHGRSKGWPGVMGTLFDRSALLANGLDTDFASGEDIELRWRLQAAGAKLGVSRRTVVIHRFGDSFEVARGQFAADGQGLALMIVKYGWRAGLMFVIPVAGAARGIALSLSRRQPRWIPYYLAYAVLNYSAIMRTIAGRLRRHTTGEEHRVNYGQP